MTSLFEAKKMVCDANKKKSHKDNGDAARHSHIHEIEDLALTMENFIYQLEACNSHNKELSVSNLKIFIYEIDKQIKNMLPKKEDEEVYDPNKLPF
tara:strand:+ start:68 stop:355 length:288 start_codon:yes stop_codon:yes gene_type:complete